MLGTLKRYFFWTYERGSFHYDVMVTLILAFIFLSPRIINYRDKPAERLPSASEVTVTSGSNAELVYQVNASALQDKSSDEALRTSLLRVIEPISGGVELTRYEPVKDANGKVAAYKAWVQR